MTNELSRTSRTSEWATALHPSARIHKRAVIFMARKPSTAPNQPREGAGDASLLNAEMLA